MEIKVKGAVLKLIEAFGCVLRIIYKPILRR